MKKKLIRFIAGAICPKCKERDKIALSANGDEIYCINCAYKETKPNNQPSPPILT